jgi:chemotaxis protein MotB
MAFRRAHDGTDDGPGAPEWMVTFSDCMTLLLTFFVLLISFSSFDEKVFRKMESAIAEGLASVSIRPTREREAFRPTPQIMYDRELDRGSEKPTVDGQYESNPNESTDIFDIQNQKVFLVASNKVFWGRGALLSSDGRQLFADLAALLQTVPNRVVIGEHGLNDRDDNDKGLERAWKAIRFLTDQQGLDPNRFSISAASTVSEQILQQTGVLTPDRKNKRVLEIVILERSVYR